MEAIRNKKRAKIHPKSMRKFIEKRSKIEAWRVPNRALEGVWAGPGRLLGPRCLQDASWAPLGRSGAGLGRQVGAKLAAKRAPKSNQNRARNRSRFGSLLGWAPGRILADLGAQNGAKLASKSDQKSIPTSNSEFSKKCGFSYGKPMVFMVQGVDFGSKIR